MSSNVTTLDIKELKFVKDYINNMLATYEPNPYIDYNFVLEYGENLIKSIVEDMKIPDSIDDRFIRTFPGYLFRNLFINYIGFAVVTKEFASNLKEKIIKDSKCLEIMCGTGALSKALQDEGVDIIATDNYSINYNLLRRWTDIEEIDCLDAIRKYGKDVDYIICSWIPIGSDIGYKALKLMNEVNPNCKMISINEPMDGATANDKFYEHNLVLEEYYYDFYKTWDGIYDYVSLIQYKEGDY